MSTYKSNKKRFMFLGLFLVILVSTISLCSVTAFADFYSRSTDLAYNKTVTVDSVYGTGFEGAKAVDGNYTTRWASNPNAGTHWISVDLGAAQSISTVTVVWETAYGVNYQIQTSNDNTNWTNQVTVTGNGSAFIPLSYNFNPVSARYVRVYITSSVGNSHVSIYNLGVFAYDSTVTADFNTQVATGGKDTFGGNWHCTTLQDPELSNTAAAMAAAGMTRARLDFAVGSFGIPCNSLADYKANVNNCQDPNTWNFTAMDRAVNDIYATGMMIRALISYSPAWLTYSGTTDGVVKDWGVYEDLVKKIYTRYQSKIQYVETWNEFEYWGNLTGSPYTNKDDLRVDDLYHVATAVHAVNPSAIVGGPVFADANKPGDLNYILKKLIATYGTTWVNNNFNYYSYHGYWYTANTQDVYAINLLFDQLGLTRKPIHKTEWNHVYWAPNCGFSDGVETIGTLGVGLVDIMTRGEVSDFYCMDSSPTDDNAGFYTWDPATQTATLLYPVRPFTIASKRLGLGAGNFSVKQTITSSNIHAVAAVNSANKPVVYIVNYDNYHQNTVRVVLNNLPGTAVNITEYLASPSNDGSGVYGTLSNVPVTNGTATFNVTLPIGSVMGLSLNCTAGSSNYNKSFIDNVFYGGQASTYYGGWYEGFEPYRAWDGMNYYPKSEWASNETNPWYQTDFAEANIDRVVISDRINLVDNCNSGTLTFSDGTSIPVTGIPKDGEPKEITFPTKTCRWVKFTVTGGEGIHVGLNEFSVYGYQIPDLACGCSATADSVYDGTGTYSADKATDYGDQAGRWSSNTAGGTHWITVDLGANKTFNKVVLNWENAYGVNYKIQTSTDNTNWTDRATVIGNSTVGEKYYLFNQVSARYVRVYCTNSYANISLYDINVYNIPTGAPVAYWNFNEGSGTTAADGTGNGHTGTLNGGAAWTAEGKWGGALSLNGNGYVGISNPASLVLGNANCTVAAWIKTTSTGAMGILTKDSNGTHADGDKLIGVNHDGTKAGVDHGWVGYLSANKKVTDGAWHHIVWTQVKDGSSTNEVWKLYIDGAYETTLSIGTKDDPAGFSVSIGRGSSGSYFPNGFNGLIDEVCIYNRVLSDAEIQALAQ